MPKLATTAWWRSPLLGPVVGAAAGTVGAIFRLSLGQADRIRDALITAAHGYRLAGFLLVLVVCGTATALAAWLVRRYSPHASGSGIPHVEAVLNGTLKPAPIRLGTGEVHRRRARHRFRAGTRP